MKIKQAFLKSLDGNETLTTWLDVQPKLKEGAIITLKEYGTTKWVVRQLWEQEHDATDFDFHRKWDNNDYSKHEGLKL